MFRLRWISLVTAIASIEGEAQSAFEWMQRAPLPASGRYGVHSFVIGEFAYVVGGGNSSGTLSECWRYDAQNDSWQQMASLPFPRRHGASFSINGKGYVACGQSATTSFSNTLFEYDPGADAWTQRASLPSTARYGSFCFAVGGYGYVGAGNYGSGTGPFLDDMWRYDASTDTWTEVSGMPGLPRYGSTGFALGSLGYVHGGRDASLDFTNELWEYDPVNDAWTSKPPMPGLGRSWTMVMAFGFDAVVAGGKDVGYNVFYDGYWYYPPLDVWTAIPDYPGESGWSGASFSLGDRVFGGLGSHLLPSQTYHSDLWELVKLDATAIDGGASGSPALAVYPNPTQSGLLSFVAGPFSPSRARLTDVAGRVVLDTPVRNHSYVDVSMVSPGVYMLAVYSSGDITGLARVVVAQ